MCYELTWMAGGSITNTSTIGWSLELELELRR